MFLSSRSRTWQPTRLEDASFRSRLTGLIHLLLLSFSLWGLPKKYLVPAFGARQASVTIRSLSAMEALKSPLTFFLIIGLVVAAIDAQDFKCELKSSKQASNYQLSDHARENMLIFSDDDITQTKSNFKAIECECDDTDNQITVSESLCQPIYEHDDQVHPANKPRITR